MTTYKTQSKTIKQALNIKNIISIRFSGTLSKKYKPYQDVVCTALARSLKKHVLTYIDRKDGQLCSGGDYFLDITKSSKDEVCKVYVKDEKVFKNNTACLEFLNKLPKYPMRAKKRYILFTPLDKEENKPDVVIFLATPAQAGRILGLSAYKKMSQSVVIPAISTCSSVFAAIAFNKIHINFIDYYDRYYQGKQEGKLLWDDNQLLVSMPFGIFKNIIKYIPLSAHGIYKPKIKPQKISPLQ